MARGWEAGSEPHREPGSAKPDPQRKHRKKPGSREVARRPARREPARAARRETAGPSGPRQKIKKAPVAMTGAFFS
ncbi:hypothetical protein GCM10010211_26920 [Streptomyces albospinus]|uniref:Uncharacterized protein n=1 Tax=Streptomyces albospinus TaxID=285515 RepID=A0ABQ2UYN1_9ACTN|nr:hypothetical protein GCM10010211_26920 [Streptomyces albospinus]